MFLTSKLIKSFLTAGALNFARVSRIFIVVKADTRMDNVVSTVRKYAEQLLDLDTDALGVLVTHMDMVTWSQNALCSCLNDDIGMTAVVFTGKFLYIKINNM